MERLRLIIVVFFLFNNGLSAQITNGLQAYFSFEESLSPFVDSINNHNATWNGSVSVSSTSGIAGQYASFNYTTSDRATLDTVSSVNNQFSIVLWARFDGSTGRDYSAIGRYYNQHRIAASDQSGTMTWQVYNNNIQFLTNQVVETGWHMIAFTYNAGAGSYQEKFYYDGLLVDSSTETSAVINNNAAWEIGSNGNNSSHWQGDIDGVGIWNRTLTTAEINEIYNETLKDSPNTWDTPPTPGLLGNAFPWFSPLQDTAAPYFKGSPAGFNYNRGTNDTPTYASRIEEINAMLGSGFNAYGVTPMGDNDASNEWVNGEFHAIGQEGFDNIRLVLYSWDADNATHLSNIATLVDSCNANGMMAIVDYHQPPWLRDSVLSEYESHVNTWLDDWYKTADYLANTKGYTPEEVVFELVNEPYNNRTKDGVNQINFTGDTWSNLLATCIDTIRAAAGNDYAIISMPYHGTFNYRNNLDATTFPDDTMLILSMHYYWPNWVTTYDISTSNHGDWEKIKPFYDVMNRDWDYFMSKGDYPWTAGEWGVYYVQDDSTKAKYINDVNKFFESRNISRSMWDFNYDFGVTTTMGGTTWEQQFLDAFKGIPQRNFLSYDSTDINLSDFSSSVDGWSLILTDGASGSLEYVDGRLKVNVDNTGTGGTLSFRVVSPTCPAVNNEIYRVSYTIAWEDSNDNIRNQSIAADMDGSWSWLHHYDVGSTGFSWYDLFYWGYASDASNNFNFYLGGGETGTMYIDNFRFERLDVNY